MSNFSNVGFHVSNEQELRELVEQVYPKSYEREVKGGTYFEYADPSGASLWIQINNENEIIGVNPHFEGKSRRAVRITTPIRRADSVMDGAFHCWALEKTKCGAVDKSDELDQYPFVFDVPDYQNYHFIDYPKKATIQLTAFAGELSCFRSEEHFLEEQEADFKWASKSFIPSGLSGEGTNLVQMENAQATGLLTGEVLEAEIMTNKQTGQKFCWIFLETLGGAIDVVVAEKYINEAPVAGNVIHGQFWLSGRVLNESQSKVVVKKGVFSRLFG